jgi:hypothetical protein
MRKLAAIALGASVLSIQPPPGMAAQTQVQADQDETTVTGDNRIICRRATRTATRMRTGRICRTVAEWRRETGGPRAQDRNSTIDEAADTLDALGADDISTNCIGNPLDRTPDTPLGPR